MLLFIKIFLRYGLVLLFIKFYNEVKLVECLILRDLFSLYKVFVSK